jgi:hypothetical protein
MLAADAVFRTATDTFGMDAQDMNYSKVFAGKTCLALVALGLLAGCATQPSQPTIFGSRIVPSVGSGHSGGVNVASGLTIFGVPTARAPQAMGGVALASMP